MPRKPRPVAERFWEKVNKTETCWLWTAAMIRGYGVITIRKPRWEYAHRWSYEQANGPIPDGHVVNHLCRVPACVNPDHLEAVTQADNVAYSDVVLGIRSAATHCKNGHEFVADNIIAASDGWRRCKACHREKQRRYLLRRKNDH